MDSLPHSADTAAESHNVEATGTKSLSMSSRTGVRLDGSDHMAGGSMQSLPKGDDAEDSHRRLGSNLIAKSEYHLIAQWEGVDRVFDLEISSPLGDLSYNEVHRQC